RHGEQGEPDRDGIRPAVDELHDDCSGGDGGEDGERIPAADEQRQSRCQLQRDGDGRVTARRPAEVDRMHEQDDSPVHPAVGDTVEAGPEHDGGSYASRVAVRQAPSLTAAVAQRARTATEAATDIGMWMPVVNSRTACGAI